MYGFLDNFFSCFEMLSQNGVLRENSVGLTMLTMTGVGPWYSGTRCEFRARGSIPIECQIPRDVDLGKVNFTVASVASP